MGFLDKLFGGNKNPADSAMPYLNQIPGVAHQYYDPFVQQGMNAYNVMNPQLEGMASDPSAFLDKILQGYQPSRSYQMKFDEGSRAAGNSAAAGGMRGSINDITAQSRLADSLMGEDMQQWLSNVLGIQGRGLQGLGNLYNTGYDASGRLSSDLTNNLGNQGQLAFQGQREKNQRFNDLLGGLGGALGGLAGLPMGGGMTLGGKLASRFI